MSEPLDYANYLNLSTLLSAQQVLGEVPEYHLDEHFFIIVHQASELWFKQLHVELTPLIKNLSAEASVPLSSLTSTLIRMRSIFRVLTQQLQTLNTLTPQAFMQFRNRLAPASGFESVQFRDLEHRLGVYDEEANVSSEPSLQKIFCQRLAKEAQPLEGLEDFWQAYRDKISLTEFEKAPSLTPFKGALQTQQDFYELQFDAMKLALFLYHHPQMESLRHLYTHLTEMLGLEEGLMQWRMQHLLMVERMIGQRPGTGGSTGATYLKNTLTKRRFFTGLRALKTYLMH